MSLSDIAFSFVLKRLGGSHRIGVIEESLRRHAQRGTRRARRDARRTMRKVLAHVALDRHLLARLVINLRLEARFVANTPEQPLPQPWPLALRIDRRHLNHAIGTIALAVAAADTGIADVDLAIRSTSD